MPHWSSGAAACHGRARLWVWIGVYLLSPGLSSFGLGLGRKQFAVLGQEHCPKRSPTWASSDGPPTWEGGCPVMLLGHLHDSWPGWWVRVWNWQSVKEWVSYLPGKVAMVWGVSGGPSLGALPLPSVARRRENESGGQRDESGVQGLSFWLHKGWGTASRRPHPVSFLRSPQRPVQLTLGPGEQTMPQVWRPPSAQPSSITSNPGGTRTCGSVWPPGGHLLLPRACGHTQQLWWRGIKIRFIAGSVEAEGQRGGVRAVTAL